MRITIFEPAFQGHYFAYVNHMLPQLLALVGPGNVTLQTSDPALKSKEFENLIQPFARQINIRAGIKNALVAPGRRGMLDKANDLVESAKHTKADHVMLMYADGIGQGLTLRSLSLRGGFPKGITSEALFFRGEFLYPVASKKDALRQRFKWELARRAPFTYFHQLDPLVYAWEQKHSNAATFARKWSLIPDAIESPRDLTKSQARAMLGLPEDGRVIGCSGVMDLRKGCDLMLRAFAKAKLAPTDRLLLCGPHKAEITNILKSELAPLVAQGRVISIDRVFKPEELADTLCAMDVVCTPYPSHVGSASIVIRAAATPRPVLASNHGFVHRSVTLFDLGWTCDVHNIQAFADAMVTALDGSPSWKPNESARRFVAFHDRANFKLCTVARVRELLKLPADEGRKSWEWVMQSTSRTVPERYT